MKRGFALLETIVVITFVMVSLLLLYTTFVNMYNNTQRNIGYDDASNIYKMYYLKEYLNLHNLQDLLNDEDIITLSCDNFNFSSCPSLIDSLALNNLYLVKYGLKSYDSEKYSSSFNNYINSLSNHEAYTYRLVGEFLIDNNYHYASIGVMSNE